MRFVDEEFLLLSRTGRFSPGTNARLGRPYSREERARRELAVHLARDRRGASPRLQAAYARVLSWTAGLTGGLSRRHYRGER